MTLTRTRPRARPLSAAEMADSIDAGTRWAWKLEERLAALYEAQVLAAFNRAADLLPKAAHAGDGLSAAAPPPPAGWSIPDPDELGLSLRAQQDALHESGETGVPQRDDPDSETAIRVEALRRTTAAGLELMHISFDARNPLVEGVLEQGGDKIGIAATTRKEIMRNLAVSFKEGDSIPAAAKRLRAAAPEVARYRSTMIARTELIGTINGGAHALGSLSNRLARENGEPVLLKIWLTAEDELVRDDHIQAGKDYGPGNGIGMDEAFIVGESAMQYPGDQDGAADEVINCRCALSYEEAGTEPLSASEDPDAQPADETPIERETREMDEALERAAESASPPGRVFAEPTVAEKLYAAGGSKTLVDLAADEWDADHLARMLQSRSARDLGVSARVSSAEIEPDVIQVDAILADSAGKPVAELTRTINLRDREVTHDSFFITDDAYQGKGIGKDVMRSSIAEYDRNDMTRVNVQAAGKNGRYTWARFGFDFSSPSSIGQMRSAFLSHLSEVARDAGAFPDDVPISRALRTAFPETFEKIEAAEHSWEFAGLSVEEAGLDLPKFGKDAMINGPSWYGYLDLAPGSEGRKVFDDYTR